MDRLLALTAREKIAYDIATLVNVLNTFFFTTSSSEQMLMGGLLALPANIRISCSGLLSTNTLAYLSTTSI
jgi:hypothetical protein